MLARSFFNLDTLSVIINAQEIPNKEYYFSWELMLVAVSQVASFYAFFVSGAS
jgi:hypothetical protein